MNNHNLTINDAKKIVFGLVIIEILFVAAYGLSLSSGVPALKALFDLDSEGTTAAWFSSIQLFLIGLAFLFISLSINKNSMPSPYFFVTLGLGFIFLSADEAASIHEKVTATLKHVDFLPRFKNNHGVWIFIYAVIVIFLIVAYFRSALAMLKSFRKESIILAIGVVTLMCGGILLEISSYQFLRTGSTPTAYFIEVAAEEFLEMCGASITLYGTFLLLLHMPLEQTKSA